MCFTYIFTGEFFLATVAPCWCGGPVASSLLQFLFLFVHSETPGCDLVLWKIKMD